MQKFGGIYSVTKESFTAWALKHPSMSDLGVCFIILSTLVGCHVESGDTRVDVEIYEDFRTEVKTIKVRTYDPDAANKLGLDLVPEAMEYPRLRNKETNEIV